MEFDHATLDLKADLLADSHDSFGTFYKTLSSVKGDGRGTLRQFKGNPASASEDLHPSVVERFRRAPNEKWPPTFEQELKRRVP